MANETGIHERLFQIMGEAKTLPKTGKYDVGANKFKFVPHDDIVKEMRMLFIKHRIMPITTVLDHKRDSNGLTEVKIRIKFVNLDAVQDFVESDGYGTSSMSNDKAFGAAFSYAVKYLFLKMFCLETGADTDDNRNDAVFSLADMSEWLTEFYRRHNVLEEKIRKHWDNHGKSWEAVEEKMKAWEVENNKGSGNKKGGGKK